MANFKFNCKKCKNKFTVDKEEVSDIKEIGNVFCPSCGDKWGNPESKIEYDMSGFVGSITRSKNSMAKENKEASASAEDQARRDMSVLDQEDPQVLPGVRKSVVDKINSRASDLI